jgi:hypothetical protein
VGRKSKAKQQRRVAREQEKLDRMEAAIRRKEFPILACECGKVWRERGRGVWTPENEGNHPECRHKVLHQGQAIFTV